MRPKSIGSTPLFVNHVLLTISLIFSRFDESVSSICLSRDLIESFEMISRSGLFSLSYSRMWGCVLPSKGNFLVNM